MEYKKILKIISIYSILIIIVCCIVNYAELSQKVIRYIEFNTTKFNFQDLLSILITIFSIFVGAIITVATVLISMCDKRSIKLIVKYKKSSQLVRTIKQAIGGGIILILILAIIYAQLDFAILIVRIILLYLAGIAFIIFFQNSKVLIELVFRMLNDSFGDDSIRTKIDFVDPENNKDNSK